LLSNKFPLSEYTKNWGKLGPTTITIPIAIACFKGPFCSRTGVEGGQDQLTERRGGKDYGKVSEEGREKRRGGQGWGSEWNGALVIRGIRPWRCLTDLLT